MVTLIVIKCSLCSLYVGIRHPEELSLLRAHDVQSAQKSTKSRPVSYSANPASLNSVTFYLFSSLAAV